MLLSLTVYISLALTLYILARLAVSQDKQCLIASSRHDKTLGLATTCAIVIFAVICGVRYNTGVDNLTYITQYIHMEHYGHFKRETFEPLFTAVAEACVKLGLHYSVFMGLWAAVQIFFVYYAMRNDKYLLPYIALFIVLGSTFLSWTNGLRQCVVGCIFIFLIEYIAKRKFWTYAVILLICSLIHKSAVILIPFYFILQKPVIPKRRLLWCGILIACAVIGMSPTWLGVMNNFESLLQFLDYDTYADNISNIVKGADETMAWGPARLGIFLLDLLTVWLYPHIKERYGLNKRFDIYFFCFFVGICLFNLLANTSHIFLRPISYFRDFRLIIVPLCLYSTIKEKRYATFTVLASLAFFYTLYVTLKAFYNGAGVESPNVYKFFFWM